MTIVRCPYCGNTLGYNSSAIGSIGNPFKTCSQCKKIYIDKHCHEYAVASPRKKLASLNFFDKNFAISFFLGGIITVGVMYLTDGFADSDGSYVLPFVIITILLDCILTYLNYRKRVGDIVESEKRCADKNYVKMLLDYKLADKKSPFVIKVMENTDL